MILAPGDLNVRQPIVDESLDGYVAAVTSDNDLVRLAHIARWGGVEHGHRPRLATLGWEALPELAALLEIDVAELQLRSYPVMAEDVGRRAFFGTTVHRSDVRTGARFFSPAALRASPHHRALWQLCFPFDTETGDVLVNACPRCKAVQRWRHKDSPPRCNRVRPIHMLQRNIGGRMHWPTRRRPCGQ